MLAFSAQEPFATCIALGRKPWENKTARPIVSWARRLIDEGGGRVRLAVHASLGNKVFRSLCRSELLNYSTAPDGQPWPAEVHPGHIVGLVSLVGVEEPTEDEIPWRIPGWWGLRLEEALQLPKPVPVKGALGFWPLPDDIAWAVGEQEQRTLLDKGGR